MIRANIHEIKAHLSEYLAKVDEGEIVLICKRNVPIAEIRHIAHTPATPRPLGLAKKDFDIPDTFFAPLPDDFTKDF